jgi:hypothetical protein
LKPQPYILSPEPKSYTLYPKVHLERATLEADAVDEIAAAAAAAAVIAAAAANVVVLRPARRERGGVAETAADAGDGGDKH